MLECSSGHVCLRQYPSTVRGFGRLRDSFVKTMTIISDEFRVQMCVPVTQITEFPVPNDIQRIHAACIGGTCVMLLIIIITGQRSVPWLGEGLGMPPPS